MSYNVFQLMNSFRCKGDRFYVYTDLRRPRKIVSIPNPAPKKGFNITPQLPAASGKRLSDFLCAPLRFSCEISLDTGDGHKSIRFHSRLPTKTLAYRLTGRLAGGGWQGRAFHPNVA
eukprot:5807762-Pyramimonas_sp.AAC.2